MPTTRFRPLAVVVAVAAVLGSAAACGGDDGDDGAAPGDASTTEVEAVDTTTTTEADLTTTTTEVDPDDDANGDGELDPFCGEADFGGGLVLQVQCEIEGLTSEVPEGVTLVPGSLFGMRSSIHRNLDGISGNLIVSRAPDGSRVFVLVFQSDALFAAGSAELGAPATFDGVVALVGRDFPGSTLQVRGHTDGVGEASANQALSEARAVAVQAHLVAGGIDAVEVTTIGFGEDRPIALEDTDEGRAFNRRVEIVVRPPVG